MTTATPTVTLRDADGREYEFDLRVVRESDTPDHSWWDFEIIEIRDPGGVAIDFSELPREVHDQYVGLQARDYAT